MLVLIDDGQQFDRVMLLFEVGWMSVVEFLNALGKVVGIEFDDSVEVAYCQHSYILLVVKLSLQNSNIPILTSSRPQKLNRYHTFSIKESIIILVFILRLTLRMQSYEPLRHLIFYLIQKTHRNRHT